MNKAAIPITGVASNDKRWAFIKDAGGAAQRMQAASGSRIDHGGQMSRDVLVLQTRLLFGCEWCV